MRSPAAQKGKDDETMPLIAHDHAYEHPHHGVGLREEGSGGLAMPVPVPIEAQSVHAGGKQVR
jgi:hypothetical protein